MADKQHPLLQNSLDDTKYENCFAMFTSKLFSFTEREPNVGVLILVDFKPMRYRLSYCASLWFTTSWGPFF